MTSARPEDEQLQHRVPADWHDCGWRATPGQVIRCDDPVSGPFYCPQCQKVLSTFPPWDDGSRPNG